MTLEQLMIIKPYLDHLNREHHGPPFSSSHVTLGELFQKHGSSKVMRLMETYWKTYGDYGSLHIDQQIKDATAWTS